MSRRWTWIRGGRLVDPATGRDEIGDVLVEGTRIHSVGIIDSPPPSGEVLEVEASGLLVTPGLIDMHAHLREPGDEEEETISSGARAAVAGGITSVASFPNTEPAIDNEATAAFVVLQGQRAGMANVFPVGTVTLGREGKQLSEMGGLARAGAVAYSDADRCLRSAEIMRRGLLYAGMFDLPVISHCEDPDLRGSGVMNQGAVAARLGLAGIPPAAEEIIVARDVRLAAITAGSLHLGHLSTSGSVEILREARARGLDVTGEVTPPHFALTDDSVSTYDPNFKVIPPLRSKRDMDALVQGLEEGVIQVIASGHAPHSPEEKQVEFVFAPAGVVGLETLFAVTYTVLVEGRGLSLLQVLEKLTINPARILRLAKDRGSLEPGKLADISIFDLETERCIRSADFASKSRNTCFEGWKVRGTPVHVFVGGRAVLRHGKLLEE